MELLKNDWQEWHIGDLVLHKRKNMYPHLGIIMNVKKIVSGWDIEVYWSLTRISKHHSNCLETI
tara:strand:+ start:252 stop:443 length:192 start_codon:yes stop_codon:yes gene_type:complete